MQVVYQRCCGMDVHKETVVACVLATQADGTVLRYDTSGNDLGSNWMTPLLNPPRGSEIQSPLLSALQLGVAWGELLGGVALALGLFYADFLSLGRLD